MTNISFSIQLTRAVAVLPFVLLPIACQQQMASQPSYSPLEPSEFFDDGLSARPLVPGAVARGHLRIDRAMVTGRTDEPQHPQGQPSENAQEQEKQQTEAKPASKAASRGFEEDATFLTEFPIPVNEAVLQHGYNRYMIYCVVCHDPLGTGRGRIIERGYTAPPSFHIDRLRNAPIGRLYAVVTEGYGSMPAYKSQIPMDDRWAIVAYLRALQLSQHFPEESLTPEMRDKLQQAANNANNAAEPIAKPKEASK